MLWENFARRMCSSQPTAGPVDMEELFNQTDHLDTRNLTVNSQGQNIPLDRLKAYVHELIWERGHQIETKHQYTRMCHILNGKYKFTPSGINVNYAYKCILAENRETHSRQTHIEPYMQIKKVRNGSGVIVITVLTSGRIFSCRYDCYYCPNEPGQPRSYLMKEPAVARANDNDFDPYRQFMNRATSMFLQGYHVDKIEIIVEGGTIACYDKQYLKWFMAQLYKAANDFYVPTHNRIPVVTLEDMLSKGDHEIDCFLDQMKTKNMTAISKIIGLTLETRPDCINQTEIEFFLLVGCTRVQLGIQHTNYDILKGVNRQCTTNDAIKAIKMLKDCGFKVDIHLMPDLPGSNPDLDIEMFNRVLKDEGLQADDWKIYPCMTTEYTEIKNWYENGTYTPYAETNLEDLIRVLMDVKSKIHPWIRINRLVRDIPVKPYVIGGLKRADLRDVIHKRLIDAGTPCKCIRCREVKHADFTPDRIENVICRVRLYPASNGLEYFISMEDKHDDTLYGFVRLRLCSNPGLGFVTELANAALIRELHVYGTSTPAWSQSKSDTHVQHRGYGKQLVQKAEEIARYHGFSKMAIISGVGVREYYRKKLDYELEGAYMTKNIGTDHSIQMNLFPLLKHGDWKYIHMQWAKYRDLRTNKVFVSNYIRMSLLFKDTDKLTIVLICLMVFTLIYFLCKYYF